MSARNMNKRRISKLLVVGISFLFVGCSGVAPAGETALVGGLIGTGVGAGAGALIGNAISNGDVTKSAIAGAGIGLATGALVGAAYNAYQDQSEINANVDQIRENHEQILYNEQEMAELREALIAESAAMEVDRSESKNLYIGPSLGAYNR